jgi:hypothetical protein
LIQGFAARVAWAIGLRPAIYGNSGTCSGTDRFLNKSNTFREIIMSFEAMRKRNISKKKMNNFIFTYKRHSVFFRSLAFLAGFRYNSNKNYPRRNMTAAADSVRRAL